MFVVSRGAAATTGTGEGADLRPSSVMVQRMATDAAAPECAPRLHLMAGGPGVGLLRRLRGERPRWHPRRVALVLVALTWLPLIVSGLLESALAGSLLRDLATHVRLLVALPVLVLVERPLAASLASATAQFVASGLVRPEQRGRYVALIADSERLRTLEAAVRAAASIGYVGAGTMEFLLDADGVLRFMEMNTRLQVEHCVSEQRSGRDLVIEQIRVAAGHPLSFRQDDITLRGHAIECRINAEDPTQNFRPAPGVISRWEIPPLEHLRVDTHVSSGYEVPPHYDSLLCKLITYGETREQACERMIAALEGLVCEGVPTTVPVHLAILRSHAFQTSRHDTRSIPGWPPT